MQGHENKFTRLEIPQNEAAHPSHGAACGNGAAGRSEASASLSHSSVPSTPQSDAAHVPAASTTPEAAPSNRRDDSGGMLPGRGSPTAEDLVTRWQVNMEAMPQTREQAGTCRLEYMLRKEAGLRERFLHVQASLLSIDGELSAVSAWQMARTLGAAAVHTLQESLLLILNTLSTVLVSFTFQAGTHTYRSDVRAISLQPPPASDTADWGKPGGRGAGEPSQVVNAEKLQQRACASGPTQQEGAEGEEQRWFDGAGEMLGRLRVLVQQGGTLLGGALATLHTNQEREEAKQLPHTERTWATCA